MSDTAPMRRPEFPDRAGDPYSSTLTLEVLQPASPPVQVDVVVLTADVAMYEAARVAIGDHNPIWRARTAEEAADLLLNGRCGVLLIDMASLSTRADTLIEQIGEQFPEVVMCVAGTRSDEPMLAPLISDGLVYRFMHKPTSARRASMFLQAAMRRHLELRAGRGKDLVLPLLRSLSRAPAGLPKKYLVLLGVVSVALTVPLFLDGRSNLPSPESASVQEAPATVPAPVTPRIANTSAKPADPVLSRARAALQAGRLERPSGRNALDLYQAVLLSHPNHAEARDGLERTISLLLAQVERDVGAGRRDEARRRLQRVLDVEPGHPRAIKMRAVVSPPDAPSLHLAREQVAVVVQQRLDAQALELAERVAAPPSLPVPSAKPPVRRVVVQPDPLAPRYANAYEVSRAKAKPRLRSYGGTVANPLPTAGYVTESAGAEPRRSTASTTRPAPFATPSERPRAADGFDRVFAQDPVYPREAMRSGIEGWVELEFTITPVGTVGDVVVVASEPLGMFEGAAVEALAQWKFRPREVNGHAVAQRSTLTMRFDLDD